MTAQEIINAWCAKKYGVAGEYRIEVEQGGYHYSTMTSEEYPEVNVYRGDERVESIAYPKFHDLLNEMLEAIA